MSKRSWLIAGLPLAALLLAGAAYKTSDIQGQRSFSAASVATSADGQTVYVADLEAVWKSTDGGASWKKVTPA